MDERRKKFYLENIVIKLLHTETPEERDATEIFRKKQIEYRS
jgi:hypothetical protein